MTNVTSQLQRESNPFATKYTRAGTLGFQFPSDDSLELLHGRLRTNNWLGQIVGPHGSGKTTLLCMLQSRWNSWHRHPQTFALHNGQRSICELDWRSWSSNTQVIVDGFEQLCVISKILLVRRCRQRRSGLLVTTHSASRLLPVVHENRTSLKLAQSLVHALTSSHCRPTITSMESCYEHCDGNLREMFMSLYDEYQSTQHSADNSPPDDRISQQKTP